MNKKQIRKLAQEIAKNERIHADINSSGEEKSRAEARIMQITKQIMQSPEGFALMEQIDELVQKELG